jgi:hypothetical protein
MLLIHILTLVLLCIIFGCSTDPVGTTHEAKPFETVAGHSQEDSTPSFKHAYSPKSKITVHQISLGMNYKQVVELWGKPSCAWHKSENGYLKPFSDLEVLDLGRKGLDRYPLVDTVRFGREPDLKAKPMDFGDRSRPSVKFGDQGEVTYVHAGSLELNGLQIAQLESGASQLNKLKEVLGEPTAVEEGDIGQTLLYHSIGLKVEMRKNLDLLYFSLDRSLVTKSQ